MDYAVHRGAALSDVLWRIIGTKRLELNQIVVNETEGVVSSGPFRGMKVPSERSWGDGDLGSKLLGTYEQELHHSLENLTKKTYGAIVNVGCAEGYYAIGLGKRFPRVPVFAYDINEEAKAVCTIAAEQNGISDRLTTRDACTADELQELAADYPHLLCFIDCEGFELELITPDTALALSASDLLIECHDFSHPGCTAKLIERLTHTHHVTDIESGARNPNAFSFLKNLDDLERWLLVCEMRPRVMNWLVCEAKNSTAA